MGRVAVDMTGQTYGQLLVVSKAPIGKSKVANWLCRCSCGNELVVQRGGLIYGGTVSCGCKRALGRAPTHGHKRGGGNGTPEYMSWRSMRMRCTKPTAKGYKYWGGRGITVCGRWLNSFENFYSDMGPRPAGTSLDRIDNNGNYEPGNCRWATGPEQRANQRRVKASAR